MRLFIAIQFSPEVKELLTDIQKELREHGVTGNFTDCANLHLTLAFIGEYNRPDKIMKALSGINFAPFTLTAGGNIGSFGDLLWVGIPKAHNLNKLACMVRDALENAGIQFDRKPFRPHITILRRANMAGFSLGSVRADEVKMTVGKISLMNSQRINGKLVYTEAGSIRAL